MTGGGGLAVHPWGGYQCADKYPDSRNYEIIDYIQGVRRTGKPGVTGRQAPRARFASHRETGSHRVRWGSGSPRTWSGGCRERPGAAIDRKAAVEG